MADNVAAVQWALREASNLRLRGQAVTMAHLAPAAEFLTKFAGPSSEFTKAAQQLAASNEFFPNVAAARMADLLQGWADYQATGFAEQLPFEAQVRVEAATDLMEQVEALLTDSGIHPAAPIMLAGAALEEFLRSMMAANGIAVSGKPGIDVYATALQQAARLTRQEHKDITSWAGRRNDAAHGRFEGLTKQEAQLMAAGINLFMQKKSA